MFHNTRSFEQWRRSECVRIASWSRFKGLEADAIVIIEVPSKDGVNVDANRYVARSRAKHLLTIIEVEQ
jgi:DNA helicase IV